MKGRKPRSNSRGPARYAPAPDHVVHFYDEDEALLQSVASFLAGGLSRGAPAIVFVVPQRAERLERRLAEMGVDVERCVASRQLVVMDSIESVERLLVDEMPHDARFREIVAAQVASMTEIWRPLQVRAFGDMVDVLVARGRSDAAVELERMWDELANRIGFALYCAYDAKHFAHEADRPAFEAICRHHGSIVPVPGGRLAPLPEPAT